MSEGAETFHLNRRQAYWEVPQTSGDVYELIVSQSGPRQSV